MEGSDPRGLDIPFRRHTLELIMSKLNELAKKSNKLTSRFSLGDLALKFEAKTYEQALNKQDYLYKIQKKLSDVMKVVAGNNQLGNTMVSRPAVQSYPAQQSFEQQLNIFSSQCQPSLTHTPSTLSTINPRNISVQTALNQSNQNPHFGLQNPQLRQHNPHFGQQNPLRHNPQLGQQNSLLDRQNQQLGQQNPLLGQLNQQLGQQNLQLGQQNPRLGQQNGVQRDALYSSPQQNGVLNVYRYKQSLESFTQPSPSQHSYPLANLQGQINQYPETRLPVSGMSSASIESQNYAALSSISELETANAEQCQLLKVQFRRARSSYLPELHKWLKMFQEQILQAQTSNEFEGPKKHILLIQQMIKLLNLPENELLLYGTDKLRQHLNRIIGYYNQMIRKVTTTTVNQMQHVHTNVPQNTQMAPTLMNRPIISSSTMAAGFSYPRVTSDQNTLLNMRNDPQMIHSSQSTQSLVILQSRNQQETGKQLMNSTLNPVTSTAPKLPVKRKSLIDSTSMPSTDLITRVSKKPCLEPSGETSKNSLGSWQNLVNIQSKENSATSKQQQQQQKGDTLTPSTPLTPTSIPKEDGIPVQSAVVELSDRRNGEDRAGIEASKSEGEPKLQEHGPLAQTPELSGSPLVSNCNGAANTQQHSSNKPIDRLMNAVKSISKEALISGVGDMRSAITEMDGLRLPEIAYTGESESPADGLRLPEIAYTGESESPVEDDWTIFLEDMDYYFTDNEVCPDNKIERDIESVSRDASIPLNIHDLAQSSTNWLSKLKPNQELLDEIKTANDILFETLIEEVETDSSDESNWTIIRCTYSPFVTRVDTKAMFASESIDLSVEFLVPFDYPVSPPKIRDCRLSEECTVGITKEMAERAKSVFESQVRCIDPLRVGAMAQAWDVCARSVLLAYADLLGAETSTSKYSGWERVVQ